MEYKDLEFKSCLPEYINYLNSLNNKKDINKYITFSPYNCKLIFYLNDFVGAFRFDYVLDSDPYIEVFIALEEKYRGKGIGSYIIYDLINEYFENNPSCSYARLSIDKNNSSSIYMALKCGYKEDEELEEELREYNDYQTLIYVKHNPYFNKKSNITL